MKPLDPHATSGCPDAGSERWEIMERSPAAATDWNRWLVVSLFAIAMAWVESAVVFDLRTLVDRIQPYQENPLPLIGKLGPVELVREFATMVMLFTAGVLAGRTWRARFGYMLVAFGVWDIFYYVFLKIMCGWPASLLDWDILFLLPLPWWGPVLAPMLIALLMILWGTLATQCESKPASRVATAVTWSVCFVGMVLALYVFMADCIQVADQGVAVIRTVLPEHFDWPRFLIALALMAAPVVYEVVTLSRLVRQPRWQRTLARAS
jgi:hypothetical protein